jgi:hypothetical protein
VESCLDTEKIEITIMQKLDESLVLCAENQNLNERGSESCFLGVKSQKAEAMTNRGIVIKGYVEDFVMNSREGTNCSVIFSKSSVQVKGDLSFFK